MDLSPDVYLHAGKPPRKRGYVSLPDDASLIKRLGNSVSKSYASDLTLSICIHLALKLFCSAQLFRSTTIRSMETHELKVVSHDCYVYEVHTDVTHRKMGDRPDISSLVGGGGRLSDTEVERHLRYDACYSERYEREIDN